MSETKKKISNGDRVFLGIYGCFSYLVGTAGSAVVSMGGGPLGHVAAVPLGHYSRKLGQKCIKEAIDGFHEDEEHVAPSDGRPTSFDSNGPAPL